MGLLRYEFFDGVWTTNYLIAAQEEGLKASEHHFNSASEALDFLSRKGVKGEVVKTLVESYFVSKPRKTLAVFTDDDHVFVI